jgi:hypothetical protein
MKNKWLYVFLVIWLQLCINAQDKIASTESSLERVILSCSSDHTPPINLFNIIVPSISGIDQLRSFQLSHGIQDAVVREALKDMLLRLDKQKDRRRVSNVLRYLTHSYYQDENVTQILRPYLDDSNSSYQEAAIQAYLRFAKYDVTSESIRRVLEDINKYKPESRKYIHEFLMQEYSVGSCTVKEKNQIIGSLKTALLTDSLMADTIACRSNRNSSIGFLLRTDIFLIRDNAWVKSSGRLRFLKQLQSSYQDNGDGYWTSYLSVEMSALRNYLYVRHWLSRLTFGFVRADGPSEYLPSLSFVTVLRVVRTNGFLSFMIRGPLIERMTSVLVFLDALLLIIVPVWVFFALKRFLFNHKKHQNHKDKDSIILILLEMMRRAMQELDRYILKQVYTIKEGHGVGRVLFVISLFGWVILIKQLRLLLALLQMGYFLNTINVKAHIVLFCFVLLFMLLHFLVFFFVISIRLKNIGYSRLRLFLLFIPIVGMIVLFQCLALPEGHANKKEL